MNVDQLGYISDTAFISATVVYALALLAHIVEWASARKVAVTAPAQERQPELV